MQNLALTVDIIPSPSQVAIAGSGTDILALAAMFAARQAQVFIPQTPTPQKVTTDGRALAGYSQESITRGPLTEEVMAKSDILVVSGRSETYKDDLDSCARACRPGHTIVVTDAPIFTAFELSHKLYQLRKRMAVTIIESGPLYESAAITSGTLAITGVREKITLAGRTVNETRTGLSNLRGLLGGMVPASNVLERVLCDCGTLLRTALKLFVVMGSTPGSAEKEKVSFTQAELAVLQAMEQELHLLGKLFNVAVGTTGPMYDEVSDSLEHEQTQLASAVTRDLVMISDLARLAYQPVPTVDSVIELSSVTLGKDLRKDGRQLTSAGLVGMDAREIIELINS